MAVYLVFSIIFSIITPKIDTLLGRKKTMALGALIQIVGKIPFILAPNNVINAYINAAAAGKKALTICTISDQLVHRKYASTEERRSSFTNMMKVALEIA